MPTAAKDERFRQLCVKDRGRLRAGSYDHASAWRLPKGRFGWCLDAGSQRRHFRSGTSRTWKGRTTRSRPSTGSAASSTTGHGPPGCAASHGAPRRAGLPSTFHAAATGNGATSGAAYGLTSTASDPALRCTAAPISSGAGSTATPGDGTAADAAHRRPLGRSLAAQRTAGRERAAVAAGSDRTARTTAPAANSAAPPDGAAAPARDAVAPNYGTPDPH